MIRTLDGTARAFLSDRYRRIDNYEIATTVFPIIGAMEGASIESCELTDSRMYIKVVNPRIPVSYTHLRDHRDRSGLQGKHGDQYAQARSG